MSKDAIGDVGCKELNLPPKDCVERKIKIFCGFIEDGGGNSAQCKQLFDEYRNGQMSSEELASKLKDKFGPEIIGKARKKIQEKLNGAH